MDLVKLTEVEQKTMIANIFGKYQNELTKTITKINDWNDPRAEEAEL